MGTSTLYQRIIGSDFGRLPAVLSQFHGMHGAAGTGTATVRTGSGLLARILARVFGLPRAGENVPVVLEVEVVGEREIWRRVFNGAPFATEQWDSGGLLAERAGPMTFYFKLHADEHGMHFEHVRSVLAGILIPRMFAPHVDAGMTHRGRGWDLHVTVTAPIAGMITSYTGYIEPSP